jgi:DNA-binding transcriptional regulator YiaG
MRTGGGDEDIGSLDVSVNYALVVKESQALYHLCHVGSHELQRAGEKTQTTAKMASGSKEKGGEETNRLREASVLTQEGFQASVFHVSALHVHGRNEGSALRWCAAPTTSTRMGLKRVLHDDTQL